MKIGVLALQGAVAEHIRSLELAGAQASVVKKIQELQELDGLVIPGGESTTIGKLMRKYGFIEAIQSFSAQGKPIFGTCAGLIVLAERIEGQDEAHLGAYEYDGCRNAFGRQEKALKRNWISQESIIHVRAVFIRAPLIKGVDSGVEVLSTYNDEIVTARQGHLLASSFHPELTDDYSLHAYFLNMVKEASRMK